MNILSLGAGYRSRSSDFAMESPRIRKTLKLMVAQLEQLPPPITSEYSLKKERIAWPQYDSDERVGWALNPVRLEAVANRIEERWRINCKATVAMSYPSRGWLLLFSHEGRDIHFEEGLLWVL
jgi:hypothetical protein